MKNIDKVVYSGDKDVSAKFDYLTVKLGGEWFFSNDLECYGIPVRFVNTDTTGDARFTIRLNDSVNNLEITTLAWDECPKYNAVIWLERNFRNSEISIDVSLEFITKYGSQTIVIDCRKAALSETTDARNGLNEAKCFSKLEINELWKYRKTALTLDGIVIDTMLKNRLIEEEYFSYGLERIYYVWSEMRVSSQGEELYYNKEGQIVAGKGLRINAIFNRFVNRDGTRALPDSLEVLSADNEHPDCDCNSVLHGVFDAGDVIWDSDDYIWTVNWSDNLTNLSIRFGEDEIGRALKQGYIEVPVIYRDTEMALRILLDPNWDKVWETDILSNS